MLPFIALLQVITYNIVDSKKIRFGRLVTLIIVLLSYIFLMPLTYRPDPIPEGAVRCGMPALAMMITYWIIGPAFTLFIHLAYWLVKRFRTQ